MISINRFQAHKIFLTVALVGAAIGLSGLGSEAFHGAARAVGGVFFILYYIFSLMKNEVTDEEVAANAQRVPSLGAPALKEPYDRKKTGLRAGEEAARLA